MRKLTLFLTLAVAIFALLFTTGCNDKSSNGTSSAEIVKLYSYIPDSAAGIFTIDFKKIVSLSLLDKFKENTKFEDFGKTQKVFKDYKDFVDKTGIDPKKDIKAAVVAVYGKFNKENPEMSAVISLKYDKQKLLSLLKKSDTDFIETDYKGVTLYSIKKETGKERGFVFLKDDVIVAGTIKGVKKVVNTMSDKGKNILSNSKMKPYIKTAGNSSIFSFVIVFTEEMKKVKGNNMIKADLSKAESIYGNVDFESNIWSGEIILVSHDEEGNTNLVTSLNGLKGIGALAGPEIAELLKGISISSATNSINLTFKISNELMGKLESKVKNKKILELTDNN